MKQQLLEQEVKRLRAYIAKLETSIMMWDSREEMIYLVNAQRAEKEIA